MQWRPVLDNVYHSFTIPVLTAEEKANAGLLVESKNALVEHPAEKLPAGAITKNGAYVPPHLRKGRSGLFSIIA